MRMYVDFCTHYYEIEFIPFLGLSKSSYQKSFDKWYYEKVTETGPHGRVMHCQRQRSDLPYKHLDIEVVLDWFRYASPESKVKIVGRYEGFTDPNTSIPTLYF